jgi:hypothetical protein
LRHIIALAAGDHETHRIADRIGEQVDQSASRASD